MSKLEAEEGPAAAAGPLCDMATQEGRNALWAWMLEQHVALCAKGGVDCRTCEEAAREGIARPA